MNGSVETPQEIAQRLNDKLSTRPSEVLELISDGYHTFKELYDFRKMYNAVLFNEWAKQGKYLVHKSYRHYDGEECFGGGWFVVIAILPTGQITNHYKNEDWYLFNCRETVKAMYEWDGHTSVDVLFRLKVEASGIQKQSDVIIHEGEAYRDAIYSNSVTTFSIVERVKLLFVSKFISSHTVYFKEKAFTEDHKIVVDVKVETLYDRIKDYFTRKRISKIGAMTSVSIIKKNGNE